MSVCVSTSTCMRVSLYIRVALVCLSARDSVSVRVYMCVCVYLCDVCKHMCLCAFASVYVSVFVSACVCLYVCDCVCLRVSVCACVLQAIYYFQRNLGYPNNHKRYCRGGAAGGDGVNFKYRYWVTCFNVHWACASYCTVRVPLLSSELKFPFLLIIIV